MRNVLDEEILNSGTHGIFLGFTDKSCVVNIRNVQNIPCMRHTLVNTI